MVLRPVALLAVVAAIHARESLSLAGYHDHGSAAIATDFMDSYNREADAEFKAGSSTEETQASAPWDPHHGQDADADATAQLSGASSESSWSSWPWNSKHTSDAADSLESAEQLGADSWESMKAAAKPAVKQSSQESRERPHAAVQHDEAYPRLSDAARSRSQEMEDMLVRARAGTLSADTATSIASADDATQASAASVNSASQDHAPAMKHRSFSAGPGEPVPVQGGQVVDVRLDSELQESLLQSLRR